jgi:hypothetical protein
MKGCLLDKGPWMVCNPGSYHIPRSLSGLRLRSHLSVVNVTHTSRIVRHPFRHALILSLHLSRYLIPKYGS